MQKSKKYVFVLFVLSLTALALLFHLRERQVQVSAALSAEQWMANGAYYVHVHQHGVFRFAPESGETSLVMQTTRHSHGQHRAVFGNDDGIYYVYRAGERETLYVRTYDAAESRPLYEIQRREKSGDGIQIESLKNSLLMMRVFEGDTETLLQLDTSSGEITYIPKDPFATQAFVLGNEVYQDIYEGGTIQYRSLHLNGASILPAGTTYGSTHQIGNNLIVQFYHNDQHEGDWWEKWETYLISVGKEMRAIPNGNYLVEVGQVLLYLPWENHSALYSYHLHTGVTRRLHDDFSAWHAVTDGTWLFATAPTSVSGAEIEGILPMQTDGWKLIFDEMGELIDLELIAEDVSFYARR